MKATTLYEQGHQWIVFGRDPNKADGIIDTNQYMVISEGRALLMDPGGIEVFAPMLGAITGQMSCVAQRVTCQAGRI